MDLSSPQNWQFLETRDFQAQLMGGDRYFLPLSLYRLNCYSPVLQVRLSSEKAKPNWQLGAWASLFAQINQTFSMIGEQRKPCKLNDNTLLQFGQPTTQIPYNLQLFFPYWIEQVRLDIWQYVDPGGIYPTDFTGLQRFVQGIDYILRSPSYSTLQSGDRTLQVSRFFLSVEYAQYEVGRFKSLTDGSILADPLFDQSPFALTVIFTSDRRIADSEITVNIRPKI